MAVRCNLIISLRCGDQTEPDTFLAGEATFASNAVVQEQIMNAIESMETEGDWIAFCVIPADFSATSVPTPVAYQGPKPSNRTLANLGLDMVGYLGRCDAVGFEGKRCVEYLDHAIEDVIHEDEDANLWYVSTEGEIVPSN